MISFAGFHKKDSLGPIYEMAPHLTSVEKQFKLIELSSINNVSLVQVSFFCSNTGSIRVDPYSGPLGRAV